MIETILIITDRRNFKQKLMLNSNLFAHLIYDCHNLDDVKEFINLILKANTCSADVGAAATKLQGG